MSVVIDTLSATRGWFISDVGIIDQSRTVHRKIWHRDYVLLHYRRDHRRRIDLDNIYRPRPKVITYHSAIP